MPIPSGWELVLVLAVIMVLFGYKRLPDATRSLGQSMRIFKAEAKGLRDNDEPTSERRTGPAAVAPPTYPTTTGTAGQPVAAPPAAAQPVAAPPAAAQPAAAQTPPPVAQPSSQHPPA